MQQHHHLQSVAWTSHQPALTADRNWWCETSFMTVHSTGTQVRVGLSPSLPAGTAMILCSVQVIQERPLSSREVSTWLSDCGVNR